MLPYFHTLEHVSAFQIQGFQIGCDVVVSTAIGPKTTIKRVIIIMNSRKFRHILA